MSNTPEVVLHDDKGSIVLVVMQHCFQISRIVSKIEKVLEVTCYACIDDSEEHDVDLWNALQA